MKIEDGEIVKALAEASVIHIDYEDGGFCLVEGCDYYFGLKLNPEQLKGLARELIEMAESVIDEAK